MFRGVTSCRLGSFVGYFASARSAGSTRSIGRGEARGKVKEGVVFIVRFQAVARARWLDLSSIFHGCLNSAAAAVTSVLVLFGLLSTTSMQFIGCRATPTIAGQSCQEGELTTS